MSYAVERVYSPDLESLAEETFSFSFFHDSYDYSDSTDVFDRTFRQEGTHNDFPTIMTLSFDYLLFNSMHFKFGPQINAGFGYNRGRGIFSESKDLSDARFQIWTLPLDLGFMVDFSFNYLILQGSGGMSVVGIIQTRTDLDNRDKDKRINQVGYGPYAIGRVKLNMSRLFNSTGFQYFASYVVTRSTVNLEARFQSYRHFKEADLSIEGVSLGLGFSFDYY